MERSVAPRVCQRPWGNHNERYYSGDERGGGAFHAASRVLSSSNMATGNRRHRSQRDDRLDVSPSLWICQTTLIADLVDPARDQMVSLAKPAKRLQGSMAPKRIEFPVKNPALATPRHNGGSCPTLADCHTVLWRVCEELHYELWKTKKVLARDFVTTFRINR
jgi:hypothetical protein